MNSRSILMSDVFFVGTRYIVSYLLPEIFFAKIIKNPISWISISLMLGLFERRFHQVLERRQIDIIEALDIQAAPAEGMFA